MKNKLFFAAFVFVIFFYNICSVMADGPANSNNRMDRPPYPIPQLYPIGQIPNRNVPGPAFPERHDEKPSISGQGQKSPSQWQHEEMPPAPKPEPGNSYPWQHEDPPAPKPQPYNPPVPNRQESQPIPQFPFYPNTGPQYNWPPQQQPGIPYYYNREPMYDPYSGQYFYWIENEPVPYSYPIPNPYGQNREAQVRKQYNPNGSVILNWLIKNVTNEDWGKKNVDIKCISGCHLLTNPNVTLWDIPYSVPRNGTLSFNVCIWQPMYGENMTFAIVAGSKTLYTFNVNPN